MGTLQTHFFPFVFLPDLPVQFFAPLSIGIIHLFFLLTHKSFLFVERLIFSPVCCLFLLTFFSPQCHMDVLVFLICIQLDLLAFYEVAYFPFKIKK